MAFRLKPDESLARGLRRIAGRQIDKALDGLTGPGGPGAAIHDARKRLKRVRALIRLARGGLGRKVADREDVRLRDAGRSLSCARDAAVLIETFDQLIERAGPLEDPEAADRVRSALRDRERAISSCVLQGERNLEATTSTLREARESLRHWEIDGDGWGTLRKGIKGTYRAGYQALRNAVERPDDEALHEWRKRVKDLWSMMEILQPIRPTFTEALGRRAHELADLLGDDHDLAVLSQVLSKPEGEIPREGDAEAFLPRIDRRRAALRADAFALGKSVYRETPRDFAARLRAYWRAWRTEVEAARYD